MNLVEKLLTVDVSVLEREETQDIEIKRLSKKIGEPFIVTVKALEGDRYVELSSRMLNKKNSVDYDKVFNTNVLVACEGIVSPDLKDKKLQDHYKCKTPKELALLFFNGGEISNIANAITELSGYGEESDEEIKN